MQRKKISQSVDTNKSIKKVILFCLIVGILIFISLLVRFLVVLKNSKFDGHARFTIAVIQKKSFRIISFDPDANTIANLLVDGSAAGSPQRSVGVPIDGIITVTRPLVLSNDPSNALLEIILHPTDTRNDITGIDLIRLYLYAKTVSVKSIQQEKISLTGNENDIDKLVTQLFADTKIIDDNLSVEIVNGTDIPGMGKRLERIINNAGGNVVAVSSSHEVEKGSKIYYYQKPSYTETRLQRMLGYPASVTNAQGIADIKIVIGEDQVHTKKF